jgi:hypothetical protein
MLENNEKDKMEAENPTLFHVPRMQKRWTARVIQQVQDEHGRNQGPPKGLRQAFTTYLMRKYETIAVNNECIAVMVGAGPRTPWLSDGELLERPIEMEETRNALPKGLNKALLAIDLDWTFTQQNGQQ